MARLQALRSALRSLSQHSSAALRQGGGAAAAATGAGGAAASGGNSSASAIAGAQQSFLRLGACGFAAAAAAATFGVGGVHCAPSAGTTAAAESATAGTAIDLSRAGIPAPSGSSSNPDRDVIFVLGGPGSGKGTQCSRLVADFPGVVHLSAGDLLRAHTRSGTPDGDAVARMIAEGQIVPSSVTISLLEAAMAAAAKEAEEKKEKEKKEEEKAGSSQKLKHRFLVDGFPRNDENRAAYESLTGSDPALVLFFDCPEAVMRQRLLGRGQGRTDDNDETIKKRFRVFVESSVPVVEYYEQKGKVAKINADRGPDEVYEDVKRVFASRTGAVAK